MLVYPCKQWAKESEEIWWGSVRQAGGVRVCAGTTPFRGGVNSHLLKAFLTPIKCWFGFRFRMLSQICTAKHASLSEQLCSAGICCSWPREVTTCVQAQASSLPAASSAMQAPKLRPCSDPHAMGSWRGTLLALSRIAQMLRVWTCTDRLVARGIGEYADSNYKV